MSDSRKTGALKSGWSVASLAVLGEGFTRGALFQRLLSADGRRRSKVEE